MSGYDFILGMVDALIWPVTLLLAIGFFAGSFGYGQKKAEMERANDE